MPAAPVPSSATNCPQCGAAVAVGEDAFLRCAHCRATLFADVDRLVRHVALRARLGQADAKGALERFLRAAEVDAPLGACAARLEVHPWWVISHGGTSYLVQGAPETAFSKAPRAAAEAGAGDPFDPDLVGGAHVVEPQIGAEDAAATARGMERDARRAPAAADHAPRLLHVPVWRMEFTEAGQTYRALVDAVEGDVDALSLPPSSTRKLDRVAVAWFAATGVAFTLEAALLRGLWAPLVAMALTGAALVALVRRGERAR